jgi:hypothetical protein
MVINYQEIYLNLNININKVPDSKKAHFTKYILKLQEWLNIGIKNNR